MDANVLETQVWLNKTYRNVAGWDLLLEDGVTGWETIYGLRRGLQHELGISPVTSGFGDLTKSRFISQVGRIDVKTTNQRLLKLVSGSLWCKGYWGVSLNTTTIKFAEMQSEIIKVRKDLGLSTSTALIDVKLMASLMSMDAYVTLTSSGGTARIRTVQRWLNGKYSLRRDFDLCPADGVFSRQVLTAMLYALQYEFGIADGTANGFFGPGTRNGLKTYAPVSEGMVDSDHNYVRLYQGILRMNGYTNSFSGTFDTSTKNATSTFQGLMELTKSGKGNYTTWCNLLVSCGDISLKTTGFDTSTQLKAAAATALVASGYRSAGRYLVGGGKFINRTDIAAMKQGKLTLFPIFQRYNDNVSHMTKANGKAHGIEALERAKTLDLPDNTVVFFSVDFDALATDLGKVEDYFRGVTEVVTKSLHTKIRVGVYATRSVCRYLAEKKLTMASFVAGASWAYSGNMGQLMPADWHYNQIEVDRVHAGSGIPIDRTRVSKKATPVNIAQVTAPPGLEPSTLTQPPQRDVFGTGFHPLYEWFCRAETQIQQIATKPVTERDISDFVAHYLRHIAYWGTVNSGAWLVYTPWPSNATQPGVAGGAVAATEKLEKWDGSYSLPPAKVFKMINNSGEINYDAPHFAATYLGYRFWGVTNLPTASYTFGDLGGWAMDLLSLWGKYVDDGKPTNLRTWTRDHIGISTGSFSKVDVIGDADAFLLAKAVTSGNQSVSGIMRSFLAKNQNDRIKSFYDVRFQASAQKIVDAYTGILFDGNEIPLAGSWFKVKVLKSLAKTSSIPSQVEAKNMALGYADYMAGLR